LRPSINLFLLSQGVQELWLNSKPSRENKKKKPKKKTAFIIFLGLKDYHGFEGVRKVLTFPLVPFAFVATFGPNHFMKVPEAVFSIQKW